MLLAGNDRDLMESFRLLERLKERAQTIIKEMKSQRGRVIDQSHTVITFKAMIIILVLPA